MRHLITSHPPGTIDPGYRLELVCTQGTAGATLDFYSTWPGCKHPIPHRQMQVTLNRSGMEALQRALWEEL